MVKGPGGVTEEERENGIAWVNDYLLLCEQRRLEGASAYLAPGAKLTFAGGFIYSNLTDMVADAARRYKWVRKNRTDFDVFTNLDEDIVVVSRGTLEGQSLSGRHFSGIRYQDRFVFHHGKIIDQQVWNDLGASGVLDPLAYLYELHASDRVGH
ncbi:MAG: hypothetical protein BGO26_13635 [Actinobacteria bacterium 69-20]|nr:hypothetical protein [Actinomycetota bacterium]OJV27626.1 MAG: hypothetical protein BGO26_13635 [Actinobacteria bacterium 69-20]